MRSTTALVVVVLTLVVAAPGAHAELALKEFDFALTNEDGTAATQAGSHPFKMSTAFTLREKTDPGSEALVPDGEIKDLRAGWPPGLVPTLGTTPSCSTADFFDIDPETGAPACAKATMVGEVRPALLVPGKPGSRAPWPVYRLSPPPGVAAKLGFVIFSVPGTVEISFDKSPPYGFTSELSGAPQLGLFFGLQLTLFGNLGATGEVPFLTLPRSCRGPLVSSYAVDFWQSPGAVLPDSSPDLSDSSWVTGSAEAQDASGAPSPFGTAGCAKLAFHPTIAAKPTTLSAASPTGLDFSIDVKDEGLANSTGLANADIEKASVSLPQGVSINPSLAEGLAVCSEAELKRETVSSAPGAGCPQAAKIGTVDALSPVLGQALEGSLFLATPYVNPFGSMLALYAVLRNPERGILIKQPLRVQADPVTGQLSATATDLPQMPFSHFKLHFREGPRSPLVSPSACGTYVTRGELTPYSGTPPIVTGSSFQVTSGPEGLPCPVAGLPPFHPSMMAGTLNNAAGRFSPFNTRISRKDAEQEITHFSIKLPAGVAGKLADIPYCSDAQIARAKARTGPQGGQEELDNPSCPQTSELGRILAGFGVGSTPAYAQGRLYLAGPYHGSPISVVSILPGRVGPFDLGTVVVREGLRIDPESAQVSIDATGSDPIPHIIQGIPVHLRDLRVYVDRPRFVLNPTNCERTSTASTLLGAGLDFTSEADDRPATASMPFQAADCAALGFEPHLSLTLQGESKRGGHPALRTVLRMSGIGESGIRSVQVTLPRSEFIASSHIKTICTKARFGQGAQPGEKCPVGSVYGHASVKTPLLAEPLTGPLFLRTSEHKLPDLVASLHSAQVDIVLVAGIDSLGGRVRASFDALPDAPVQTARLSLFGAGKGLIENSTNLCRGAHRAEVRFIAQNGRRLRVVPELHPSCSAKRRNLGVHR